MPFVYNKNMRIIKYNEVNSTQLVAKGLAKSENDLTLVLADNQTSGIGRYDRKWVSGIGGLWGTWILKQEIPIEKLPFLALFVGYFIHQMLWKDNIKVNLKYPNDILFVDKKLAGILCNSSICGNQHIYSLVGIGLNVSNNPPPEGVSLDEISKRRFEIPNLINAITDSIVEARNLLIKSDPKIIFSKLSEINTLNLPLDNNLNSL